MLYAYKCIKYRNKIIMSEELRQQILIDEERQAKKKRLGLFSQPPPLAIGDDSAYKQIQSNYMFILEPRG